MKTVSFSMKAAFIVAALLASALYAQESAAKLTSEHQGLSTRGFTRTAVSWAIPESFGGRFWLALNHECANPERIIISDAEKLEGSFVIEVSRLKPGENTVRLCSENTKGRITSVTTLTLLQDDKPPEITLEPPPGDYDVLPAIAIKTTVNAAGSVYTVDGSEPRFAAFDSKQNGEAFSVPFALSQNDTTVKAVSVSAAGIISPVVSGRYRVDRRLMGWNERTFLIGYENVQTLGSVKTYLPSAQGASLGFRLGLDAWLNPKNSGLASRRLIVPGLLTQAKYLHYSNGGYSESVIGLNAGPEWAFPLSVKNSIFFLTGVTPGLAHISVKTPSKENNGMVFNFQMHAGFEWQLGVTGFFAHLKYVWFADEVAPLAGWGGSAGALLRL